MTIIFLVFWALSPTDTATRTKQRCKKDMSDMFITVKQAVGPVTHMVVTGHATKVFHVK